MENEGFNPSVDNRYPLKPPDYSNDPPQYNYYPPNYDPLQYNYYPPNPSPYYYPPNPPPYDSIVPRFSPQMEHQDQPPQVIISRAHYPAPRRPYVAREQRRPVVVSMRWAYLVSCITLWLCCGIVFGLIAFILAVRGAKLATDGETVVARRLRTASYIVSIVGITAGIVALSVTLKLLLSIGLCTSHCHE